MKEGKGIKAIGYEAAQEEIGNNSHLTVSKGRFNDDYKCTKDQWIHCNFNISLKNQAHY